MEAQYTAKDYIAAVFNNGQADRIPIRTMQSFSRILDQAGVTGKEVLVSLGVDGLSIDAPASLKKLVGISNKGIVIEGNFPGELYIEGTKEQIEEKVKESVEIAAEPNGYRYILCSGCQVPDTAPLENVRTFLEAGHRYGKRPPVS